MIAEKIVELTKGLKGIDLHVTVETAGTVYKPVVCDLMSISPKLANSTPRKRDGGKYAAHQRGFFITARDEAANGDNQPRFRQAACGKGP